MQWYKFAPAADKTTNKSTAPRCSTISEGTAAPAHPLWRTQERQHTHLLAPRLESTRGTLLHSPANKCGAIEISRVSGNGTGDQGQCTSAVVYPSTPCLRQSGVVTRLIPMLCVLYVCLPALWSGLSHEQGALTCSLLLSSAAAAWLLGC